MAGQVTIAGENSNTPGLQLHLVDSDDEPLDERAGGARRPSTASLSRFRSCPQLSSADTHHTQDSPGSDDHGLGPELCVGNVHFTQGSPRPRPRRQNGDNGGQRSQSPTPPSSPRSKPSQGSLKDSSTPGARGGTAEPSSAGTLPKAAARAAGTERAALGRAVSTDSPYHDSMARRFLDDSNVRSENQTLAQFFEEPPDISIDGRLTVTEDGASTPLGGERSYHADQDSIDKCARWLQSLKMTSGDRLKSRSHIQLPPI